jgi:hypothetical protein
MDCLVCTYVDQHNLEFTACRHIRRYGPMDEHPDDHLQYRFVVDDVPDPVYL